MSFCHHCQSKQFHPNEGFTDLVKLPYFFVVKITYINQKNKHIHKEYTVIEKQMANRPYRLVYFWTLYDFLPKLVSAIAIYFGLKVPGHTSQHTFL